MAVISSKVLRELVQEKFTENLNELMGYDPLGQNSIVEPELLYKYYIKWYDKLSFTRELEVEEPYTDSTSEYNPIHIVYNEETFEQDESVPLGIYQSNVSLSMMIEEKFIDDFYQILKNFIIKNKVVKFRSGNDTAMITIDSGWDDDRVRVRGKKMYMADMSIEILVLSSATFSNDVEIKLDGIVIEGSTASIISDTEVIHSLKKRWDVEFIPNTTITQLLIVGFLDLTNLKQKELVNHINSGELFDKSIAVSVIAYPDQPPSSEGGLQTTILSRNMIVKSVQVDLQRGSVAIVKLAFVNNVTEETN